MILNGYFALCFKIHAFLEPTAKIWIKIGLHYQRRRCSPMTLHCESKNKTPNVSISSPSIDRFSKFFHCTFSRKFAIKRSLQITSYLKDFATLPCEILVFKNVPNESTVTADQARPHRRECYSGRWAGNKPTRLSRPATNSSLNTLNSTIWCHTDHVISPRLWFEVF